MRKLLTVSAVAVALFASGSVQPVKADPIAIPIILGLTAAAFGVGIGCGAYDLSTGRDDCGMNTSKKLGSAASPSVALSNFIDSNNVTVLQTREGMFTAPALASAVR